MAELIVDPEVAKAEQEAAKLDMDAPCSRKEVAQYVHNYFQANIQPLRQHQNHMAQLLNWLLDFLGSIGLRKTKKGRLYRLDPVEFHEFCESRAAMIKKQAEGAQAKQAVN